MIEFDKKIVQLGFGAVGKSFFEKVSKEIKFDINKYFVISRDKLEYSFFIELGGNINNFIVADINRNNFKKVFSNYIDEGDFLIDFADGVGTRDFVEWCANKNVMYLNTGETDWEDNWYSIFEENLKKNELRNNLKQNSKVNKYPIVLQHGNNPGLVSHFVKSGLEYIVKKQFKKNEYLNKLLKENKFNELAKELKLKEIHVNDKDYQKVKDIFDENKLYSTWSVDSFFFEMLSEATANIGTDEKYYNEENCKRIDFKNGFLEFKDLAINKVGKTYYPKGKFEAYLVPHEETITIAKNLEVKKGEETIYRPTVVFLYSPCEYAIQYLKNAKVNSDYIPDFHTMQDIKSFDNNPVIRGFKYPERAEIIYKEKIKYGTEYVGVLLLGSKFEPVWVGNRIKKNFLYKDKRASFWQTPTITPVAMSALAASCWMIKNKDKGGIYFPDDIKEYNEIIHFAEKYISKTIYKTFSKEKIQRELNINLETLELKDILK
ncbi:MAG: hypothetical protein HFJ46_00675 [Clostridia bacterium]|nr:hypothetical protein [Clostridia bacterium]